MLFNKKNKITNIIAGTAIVAAVTGVILYAYLDDDANERVRGMINREKVKAYVKHTLNGSDHLVNMVNDLSDEEVNTLIGIANKTKATQSHMSEGFKQIINRAKELADDAGEKVNNLF
ncbi:hypothetical protein [Facklamia miroungae]|uniref:Uncharacterized protein n=1 Tax=Facklamia miroungae TaxID=120956 RepID=A0A1G7SSS7_9LACT|nr:hypothetical protein [Facklamia miroungae]NKZ29554.1 hypothetical protein [Facklamia miroungae]SDG25998.1 hypothetical protein SAMN05421791_104141 [Facklamia miroungae]